MGDLGSIPGLQNPLEKGKATEPIILAWKIPGSQRVGHSSATFTASQSMTKEAILHNVGKTVSSISGAGKTGQLHVKK